MCSTIAAEANEEEAKITKAHASRSIDRAMLKKILLAIDCKTRGGEFNRRLMPTKKLEKYER